MFLEDNSYSFFRNKKTQKVKKKNLTEKYSNVLNDSQSCPILKQFFKHRLRFAKNKFDK